MKKKNQAVSKQHDHLLAFLIPVSSAAVVHSALLHRHNEWKAPTQFPEILLTQGESPACNAAVSWPEIGPFSWGICLYAGAYSPPSFS